MRSARAPTRRARRRAPRSAATSSSARRAPSTAAPRRLGTTGARATPRMRSGALGGRLARGRALRASAAASIVLARTRPRRVSRACLGGGAAASARARPGRGRRRAVRARVSAGARRRGGARAAPARTGRRVNDRDDRPRSARWPADLRREERPPRQMTILSRARPRAACRPARSPRHRTASDHTRLHSTARRRRLVSAESKLRRRALLPAFGGGPHHRVVRTRAGAERLAAPGRRVAAPARAVVSSAVESPPSSAYDLRRRAYGNGERPWRAFRVDAWRARRREASRPSSCDAGRRSAKTDGHRAAGQAPPDRRALRSSRERARPPRAPLAHRRSANRFGRSLTAECHNDPRRGVVAAAVRRAAHRRRPQRRTAAVALLCARRAVTTGLYALHRRVNQKVLHRRARSLLRAARAAARGGMGAAPRQAAPPAPAGRPRPPRAARPRDHRADGGRRRDHRPPPKRRVARGGRAQIRQRSAKRPRCRSASMPAPKEFRRSRRAVKAARARRGGRPRERLCSPRSRSPRSLGRPLVQAPPREAAAEGAPNGGAAEAPPAAAPAEAPLVARRRRKTPRAAKKSHHEKSFAL